MSLVLKVTDASVLIRGRIRLDGVSVTARSGRVHALIGANGSGKSTLLNAMAGELALTSGHVEVSQDGHRPRAWSDYSVREAAQVRALLAQDTPIAFAYQVVDVIRWGRLAWRGEPQQGHDDEVINEEVSANDVSHLLHRRITELSGGERARVHLARVLSQRAPLLLLDEADATLDLVGQAHLDDAIGRRRNAGDAIVMISHDLTRVAALADDVTVLAHGRVLATGTVAQTMTSAVLSEAFEISVSVSHIDGSLVIRRD